MEHTQIAVRVLTPSDVSQRSGVNATDKSLACERLDDVKLESGGAGALHTGSRHTLPGLGKQG